MMCPGRVQSTGVGRSVFDTTAPAGVKIVIV